MWTNTNNKVAVPKKFEKKVKSKLLLRVPADEKYKRAQHFLQLFPVEELEYCTNVAIQEAYEEGDVPDFDCVSFFAAQFSSRHLDVGSKDGYMKDIEFLNQTAEGHAFSKLPQDTYEA